MLRVTELSVPTTIFFFQFFFFCPPLNSIFAKEDKWIINLRRTRISKEISSQRNKVLAPYISNSLLEFSVFHNFLTEYIPTCEFFAPKLFLALNYLVGFDFYPNVLETHHCVWLEKSHSISAVESYTLFLPRFYNSY